MIMRIMDRQDPQLHVACKPLRRGETDILHIPKVLSLVEVKVHYAISRKVTGSIPNEVIGFSN
jgi:hypothetical protein